MDIDVEFQLVRLKYVDILETSLDMMDAVSFANRELSLFHQTHAEGKHELTWSLLSTRVVDAMHVVHI